MLRRTIALFLSVCCFTAGFSQSVRDVLIPSDSIELNGTLMLPEGEGPFPVLIMVHGSGPNDRDGTIVLNPAGYTECLYPELVGDTIKPFLNIAHALLSEGIASLRYDKRTFSHLSEIGLQIEFMDFVNDADAAVSFIKTQPEIDTSQIFLLGHSQGSDIIPEVAAGRSDVRGLIALGGPFSGIDSLITDQIVNNQARCFQDTTMGPYMAAQMLEGFAKIRDGSYPEDELFQGGTPTFWKQWIDVHNNLIPNLKSADIPMLFIHGDEDYNVPFDDVDRFEEALKGTDFTAMRLNGVTHFGSSLKEPEVVPA